MLMHRIRTCSSKTMHALMSRSQREVKKNTFSVSLMKTILSMEDTWKIEEITGLRSMEEEKKVKLKLNE